TWRATALRVARVAPLGTKAGGPLTSAGTAGAASGGAGAAAWAPATPGGGRAPGSGPPAGGRRPPRPSTARAARHPGGGGRGAGGHGEGGAREAEHGAEGARETGRARGHRPGYRHDRLGEARQVALGEGVGRDDRAAVLLEHVGDLLAPGAHVVERKRHDRRR